MTQTLQSRCLFSFKKSSQFFVFVPKLIIHYTTRFSFLQVLLTRSFTRSFTRCHLVFQSFIIKFIIQCRTNVSLTFVIVIARLSTITILFCLTSVLQSHLFIPTTLITLQTFNILLTLMIICKNIILLQ